jgi:type II secretory pathway component PulF
MPVFEYRAVDNEGKPVTGTVFGASLNAVADDLAQRGLTVERLGLASIPGDPVPRDFAGDAQEVARKGVETLPPPVTDEPTYAPRPAIITDVLGPIAPVSLSALLFFFRQLSTMLSAGVNMVQSLDTLSTQTADPRLRAAIREFREHALAGRPITAGMQRYPEMFSPVMISLTRVGEEMGTLDKSLKLIAHYIEREIELRNLYRRLLLWPKIVVASSIFIILGANSIIAFLGKPGGISSPLTTLSTWVVLGPLIVLAFLFFRIGVRQPAIRSAYDQFLQSLPYLGTTLSQIAMAKFGRAFGALHGGGVPIAKSVQLAADSCGNEFLRAKMYPAARDIENGTGVADAFSRTGAFSPIVLDMTRTGETTGNLDLMLTKLAEYYEDDARVRSTQTAYIVFIVVYLAVAIYVAYVVISFYAGYFGGMAQGG